MTFGLKKEISPNFLYLSKGTPCDQNYKITQLFLTNFFIIGLNKHVHNKDLMRFSDDIPTHF